MSKKQSLGALLVKIDFYLIVLGHLIAVDTNDRTVSEDPMGNAIPFLPRGRDR